MFAHPDPHTPMDAATNAWSFFTDWPPCCLCSVPRSTSRMSPSIRFFVHRECMSRRFPALSSPLDMLNLPCTSRIVSFRLVLERSQSQLHNNQRQGLHATRTKKHSA